MRLRTSRAFYPSTFRLLFVGVVVLAVHMAFPYRVGAQPEVRIHTDSSAQVIRGFGAAFIHFWRPDMSDPAIDAAFGTGEGQLGLSILRLGIDPNPARWGENLHTASRAHELGATIIASPWNAPPETEGSEGAIDTVRYDMFDAYAAHLDSFNTFMTENGVPVYAISVQNEPDIEENWTSWSTEGMLKFVRENASAIGTRVMAPESFQFRREMSDPILLDPVAAANVDIIAGHIYGGGLSSYPLAEEHGKEVWMTEYLLNLNTGNTGNSPWSSYSEDAKWEETMNMLNTIQVAMQSNMNAYVWWYLERYYSFLGDGTEGTQLGEVLKRGHAFSNYSRFIRPGYERIETEGPVARGYLRVTVTAYRGPDRTVFVAINGEDTPRELTFVVEEATSATFQPYVTSLTQNVERGNDLILIDNSFTTTLPPESITTFVSDDFIVSNEASALSPSAIRLSQNYPNPFKGETRIRFSTPHSGQVKLVVYDALGRSIATLVNRVVPAGTHEVTFDASHLVNGMYLYRLEAGGASQTRGMMLMK